MCGLVGIYSSISTESSHNVFLLEKMRQSIEHRGPDGHGNYHNDQIFLAHNRLSIIDIEHGQQPMLSSDKRFAIVFNGEIYNYEELREELLLEGAPIRTRSDTETLLYGYIHWGEKVLSRLNGMFAFAIWDNTEKSLFLARDRMGVKPLYWTKNDDKIFFGSEIKSLLVIDNVRKEINYEAISSYLTFRQAVGNLSFFKYINKVEPGTFLKIYKDKVSVFTYYDLPVPVISKGKDEENYINSIDEKLSNSISQRMISDVPVGAYLSGGLDSSLMVALMKSHSNSNINTYSIGYDLDGYDEGEYAKLVSKHCKTRHQHFYMGASDYFEQLKATIRLKDQPLSIPHEVALHKLSKEISNEIKVVLSGEGADELFGGYGRVQRSPMDWKKIKVIKSLLPNFVQSKINMFDLDEQGLNLSDINTQLEHFFYVYNWVPFSEKQNLFATDFYESIDNDRNLIKQFEMIFKKVEGLNPYDKILYVFEKIHLSCLLERLDMMSMSASLEARVPFVDDHKLVEYAMTIPHEFKLRWKSQFSRARALFVSSNKASEWLDSNKYILRKVASNYLPKEISLRKKLGFPTPLDKWLSTGFIETAKEILLDFRSLNRGIYNFKYLNMLFESPQKLSYDFYGKKIWMMLNVEIWLRMIEDEY